MCATERLALGICLCLVPDVDDLSDILLGNRVEADDAAVEGLVELEVLLLRTLHVQNVDRVVVRLQTCVRLVLLVRVLVHGVDMRKENCLSSFVCFANAWYKPSMFDGRLSCFASPIWWISFRLLHSLFRGSFCEKTIRLNLSS